MNKANVVNNKLNWQGWAPEKGSKLEYFINEQTASKCTIPCKKCGFFYLDKNGIEYENSVIEADLCGI
jgi:hypothetical protein